MSARLLQLGAVSPQPCILAAASMTLLFPTEACCFLTIHARYSPDKALHISGPSLLIFVINGGSKHK